MNNLDLQYQSLLKDIIENGVKKKTRNGETISVFGRQIRHRMSEGFPLLTTKKMAFKTMVTELLWFLKGDTNIKYLVDNGCHIWDGDAYKNYLKEHSKNPNETAGLNDGTPFDKNEFIALIQSSNAFAHKWGSLGKIYGAQWRNWNGGIDQIANLINELKTNPDSRRLIVSAWNASDLQHQVLPPCHYGFQMYTRELSFDERHLLYCKSFEGTSDTHKGSSDVDKMTEYHNNRNIPTRAISLMWNQRSCDFPLGIPMNISSYSLLLMMIAKQVNMIPDELIGNLGDAHIYLNQIEGVKEQLTRTPYELPTIKISDRIINDISEYEIEDFTIENYKSHSKIKIPLSN